MDESGKIEPHIIKKHANVLIDEKILARIKLLRKHSDAYRSILKYLNDLTKNMTSGVKFQRKEARTIYQIAIGEITWDKLNEQGKRSIARKPDLMKAIDSAISRLRNNIILLNKVGKLLRDEPELGRVMAMRKNVYMGKLNVRKMLDDICNAVERSNNLKKKARIVEGSRTRVEPDEAELLLKSGELILCIVGLYHLLKGWKGHGSPINLSDVRLIRPA